MNDVKFETFWTQMFALFTPSSNRRLPAMTKFPFIFFSNTFYNRTNWFTADKNRRGHCTLYLFFCTAL